MKFVCIKKCFYQNRLWNLGETLDSPTSDVSEHFSPKETAPKKEEKEVLTFSEMAKEEADSVLKGVGHKWVDKKETEDEDFMK